MLNITSSFLADHDHYCAPHYDFYGLDVKQVIWSQQHQAAESTGVCSLVGGTVAPGFEFEDFSFLRDDVETKEKLLKKFPDYLKFI